MYIAEPSHNSAFFLYRLYAYRGDVDNAIKYMQEAINYEESDADTDADAARNPEPIDTGVDGNEDDKMAKSIIDETN